MRIGIDLLWVRPGKNGGTESYIRNLLDGFSRYADKQYRFILFTTHDNVKTFAKYKNSENFEIKVCSSPSSQAKRVAWETLHLNECGEREKLDVWFYPVYSRPLFPSKKIPNVTVIHDLQGLHYPEYFSRGRNAFFRLMWKRDVQSSTKVMTISEFCKKDIIDHYHIDNSRVKAIYNAIDARGNATDLEVLKEKYGIEKQQYFYTLSSLAKHKNLITLLKAVKILKNSVPDIKLLISGVKVNAEDEINQFIKDNDLTTNIVYTGFISNEDRNGLIDNCRKFLFSSVFEGFGMPPIEAMIRGVPVLMTKCTSLEEVTEDMCEYVEDPMDAKEWSDKMVSETSPLNQGQKEHLEKKYSLQNITNQYLEILGGFGK